MKLTAKSLKQLILEVIEDKEEPTEEEDDFDYLGVIKQRFKEGGEATIAAVTLWSSLTGNESPSDTKFSKLYDSDWENAGDAKSYNSIKFYFETEEGEKAFKSLLDSMGYENDLGIIFGQPQPGKYFYEERSPEEYTMRDIDDDEAAFEVIV